MHWNHEWRITLVWLAGDNFEQNWKLIVFLRGSNLSSQRRYFQIKLRAVSVGVVFFLSLLATVVVSNFSRLHIRKNECPQFVGFLVGNHAEIKRIIDDHLSKDEFWSPCV